MKFEKKALLLQFIFIGLLYFFALNNSLDFGDSTHYLVGAKSILNGSFYHDISLVNGPSIIQYPPAYSFFLAGVFLIFGYSFFAAKFFSLVFTLSSIFLAFLLFKAHFSEKMSFVLSFVFSANLLVLWYSHRVLSEPIFLFFSLLSVVFLEKYFGEKKAFSKNSVASNLFLALSILARTIGATLSIAAAFFLITQKKYKKALVVAILPILIFSLWVYYVNSNIGSANFAESYFNQVFLKDVFNPHYGVVSPHGMFLRIIGNSFYYFFVSIPQAVFSPLDVANWFFQNNFLFLVLSICVGLVFLFGFFSSMKKNPQFAHFYLFFYMSFLIIWPALDTSAVDRFLLPVLPFLLIFFAFGLKFFSAHFKINEKKVLFLVFSICIIFSLGSGIFYLNSIHSRQFNENYLNFVDATNWIDSNTKSTDVFWSSNPQAIFLLSERKSAMFNGNENILNQLEKYKISYVFVSADASQGDFEKKVEQIKENLTLVFEGKDHKTKIYQFQN